MIMIAKMMMMIVLVTTVMTLANWSILARSSTQEFTLNSTFERSASVVSDFFLVCKKGLLLKN